MLDIKVIRSNPEEVKAALNRRNGNYDADIDRLLEIDQKRREVSSSTDAMKAEQNAASKQIPAMKKEGKDASALLARMKEVLADTSIDETRIVTEAAIYADKTAVDEETVRLRSHLQQLDGMLNEVKPVGRKLDFLVQEMNRETNTIGSKANDVSMAQIVVNIKSEIEKIREQIQNIE